jgi:tyrosinase
MLTIHLDKGVIGPGIHFNGIFLSWHRYLVWNYETALINECNYTGAQPFWDWTLDTPEYNSSFEKSPIFDPTHGFGGNGIGGSVFDPLGPGKNQSAPPKGTCIGDGPFKDFNGTMGYGYNLFDVEPHCLIRNFNSSLANKSLQWSTNIKHLLSFKNYWNMSQEWDTSTIGAPAGPHGGGHGGVNGEMRNVWSSINDPLFFMHHTQIDHVWWIWQNQAPENKFAIGGPTYPNGTGPWVTLDYPVEMASFIAPDTKARNVMDTLNVNGEGSLCYTYDDFRFPNYR